MRINYELFVKSIKFKTPKMSDINSPSFSLKRYIPVLPQDIGLKILESKSYFTSIKYDGYLAILTIKKNEITLRTKNNKPLVPSSSSSAPSSTETAAVIKQLGFNSQAQSYGSSGNWEVTKVS